MRTNRTCADAAIADAAFTRPAAMNLWDCGIVHRSSHSNEAIVLGPSQVFRRMEQELTLAGLSRDLVNLIPPRMLWVKTHYLLGLLVRIEGLEGAHLAAHFDALIKLLDDLIRRDANRRVVICNVEHFVAQTVRS